MLSIRCDWCGACDKLSSCSKCKGVYYCCKDHQVSGWKTHRNHSIKSIASKIGPLPNIIQEPKLYIESDRQLSTSLDRYCIDNRFVESRKPDGKVIVNNNGSYTNDNEVKCTNVKRLTKSDENSVNRAVINNLVNKQLLDAIPNYKSQAKVNTSENVGKAINDDSYDFLANICYEILNKPTAMDERVLDDISREVVKDLNRFGVYVLDNFLGCEKGLEVLKEVQTLHTNGAFQDGQLQNDKKDRDSKAIRSDRIAWIDGKRADCEHINNMIKRIDKIIMKCNRMSNNGEMGKCKIDGRTKAMVACYPAGGSHYVKHVDNPNQDGRRITVIYYLNRDWDSKKDGGLLRIFPSRWKDCVADIEPQFDRLLFFWSDRRNPHEVQPAFRSRYAITLWYLDADERKQATHRTTGCVPTDKRLKTSTCNQQNLLV